MHTQSYAFNPHALHSTSSNTVDSFTEETDLEYQQLHENDLKNCSLERQKAEKSELGVQPQLLIERIAQDLQTVLCHASEPPETCFSPQDTAPRHPLLAEKAQCDKATAKTQETNGPRIL